MVQAAGKIDNSILLYIVQDAGAASPGEPATGLTFSNLTSASYVRPGSARVAITPVTLASPSAAHADGGFVEIDGTNLPGLYRFDIPDAAVASGADQVAVHAVVAGASNAVASPVVINIFDVDLRDAVRAGLSALPNAAADAAGGLPISDAGGLDLDGRLDVAVSSRLASASAPLNFSDLAISATTGLVSVGTNNDKSGYTISGTKQTLDDLQDVAATQIVSNGAITTNAGAVSTVTNVSNLVTSNVTQISGDSLAADNLKDTFNGVGFVNDNAPATQSQLSGLANVGSAVNESATGYTLTTGTQTANTFTATKALDGVRHTHTDVAGAIKLEYQFQVQGSPSSCRVTGYVNGPGDNIDVFAYDYIAAQFVQIGTIQGSSSTANQVFNFE